MENETVIYEAVAACGATTTMSSGMTVDMATMKWTEPTRWERALYAVRRRLEILREGLRDTLYRAWRGW